ncbi:hypothetical protein SELMODRAFT_427643 [Selaginella moellendorffii]|uniref:Uncharacterized protein n=1 Tax=Selaginella moellendorffii TaxID=88036 RepID=D8T096_SELML|nr:hypothetical protein SELMODRAFT_427643 [Selaginella moellendorffii]
MTTVAALTHPSYFSVVMFTWLDMIGFQLYESYITYWVANTPAGSFGPGKGKAVLPYMSPLATNKFLQFSAKNNSYSFALVPQGSNLVGPIVDNRRSPALAKAPQHYNCTGDFIEIIDFTTSTSQS